MKYRLVTFDVYSALFDYRSSLLPLLKDVLPEAVDHSALLQTWRSRQLELTLISNSLQRERISFRVATRLALDYALNRAKQPLPESTRRALVEAWDGLKPWPEAEEVLNVVQARHYPIAVLSNGDQAMLRVLMGTLSVGVDHFFASDHAGYYKPHPAIYLLPLKALGLEANQVLHVAGGANDVMGAKSAGLPCAWSNRNGDQVLDPTFSADYEFRDLRGLLGILD
jgi:2-haloacid dehalogenase